MSTPHPEVDELADLDEGLLSSNRAAELETHVAGCARCTDVHATVRAVTIRLAELPAPALPAAVGARIDAALADEARHRPARLPATASASGSSVVELGSARTARARRTWWRGVATTAAVVAVVLGAIAVIAPRVPGGGSSSMDSATSAGQVQRDGAGPAADAARPQRLAVPRANDGLVTFEADRRQAGTSFADGERDGPKGSTQTALRRRAAPEVGALAALKAGMRPS